MASWSKNSNAESAPRNYRHGFASERILIVFTVSRFFVSCARRNCPAKQSLSFISWTDTILQSAKSAEKCSCFRDTWHCIESCILRSTSIVVPLSRPRVSCASWLCRAKRSSNFTSKANTSRRCAKSATKVSRSQDTSKCTKSCMLVIRLRMFSAQSASKCCRRRTSSLTFTETTTTSSSLGKIRTQCFKILFVEISVKNLWF